MENQQFEVIPRTFDEDPELTYSEQVLSRIAAIPGVGVRAPVVVAGGDKLYGSAVELWPAAAGDPAKMLGIGTWDPFDNVERDYAQVFCRPCPADERKRSPAPRVVPVTPPKPWWKF